MADERRALREFAGYHAYWAGRSYLRAGDYDKARPHFLRAIGERTDGVSGSRALVPGRALDFLLDAASLRGRPEDVRQAIAAYGEAFGDDEVRSTPYGDGLDSMVTARSLWSFHLARALIRSGDLLGKRDILRSSMNSVSGSAWITVEPDEERVLVDLRKAAEDLKAES